MNDSEVKGKSFLFLPTQQSGHLFKRFQKYKGLKELKEHLFCRVLIRRKETSFKN